MPSTAFFTTKTTALFLFLGIFTSSALSVSCANKGHVACGNQFGAPPPDGAIYVCNALMQWELSDHKY
ncbi:hypothetical protein B0T21DRAFT_413767 [Apiosordaria backusii]|uniref:Uncharacterized protein n=1 Tax=Apiosordaria backusii TaxID=314023 RepID=A0AA40B2J7_9PEZI|nr:hypothetical protein B0T21DRAFT_413767 [Apiosordaria backusii]